MSSEAMKKKSFLIFRSRRIFPDLCTASKCIMGAGGMSRPSPRTTSATMANNLIICVSQQRGLFDKHDLNYTDNNVEGNKSLVSWTSGCSVFSDEAWNRFDSHWESFKAFYAASFVSFVHCTSGEWDLWRWVKLKSKYPIKEIVAWTCVCVHSCGNTEHLQ